MRIAVTGGKGGTGKSTIATALAVELSKKYKVLLMDLDVDCPDDHIILSVKRKKAKDVTHYIPVLDKKKCIKCGRCSEVCKENAVVHVKDKHPMFVLDQCIGCTACMIACPVGAIGKRKLVAGHVYTGEGAVDFISGELTPTQKEGSPIVNAVKKFAAPKEKNYDFVILDTAAGTHCPVISAIMGCDLALAVTEPTPLGAHTLDLILKVAKELEVPCHVVLNRAGIADESILGEHEIFARIPYSKDIAMAYARGEPVKHKSISQLAKKLEEMK